MNILLSNLGFHTESNDSKLFSTLYVEVTSPKVLPAKSQHKPQLWLADIPDKDSDEEAISELHIKMAEGTNKSQLSCNECIR